MSYRYGNEETPLSAREAVGIGAEVAARLRTRGALIGSWIAAVAAITSAIISGYMLQQVSVGNNETTRDLADLERALTEVTASAGRFQTAGEHLGSESSMTRLIGLHSLSALAADRPEYAQRSAQIAAGFIKLHADGDGQPNPGVRPLEIDTAHSTLLRLSKIGKQYTNDNENSTFMFDLANQSIRNKDWSGLYAHGAYFYQTRFVATNLAGANFVCVDATRSEFLEETNLSGARFEYADITGADFSGASGFDLTEWSGVYWDQSSEPPTLPQGFSFSFDPISFAERKAACPD